MADDPRTHLRRMLAAHLRDFTCSHVPLNPGTAVGQPEACPDCLADAVLAALFRACTVREDPHMWLHGGIRTERALVLRFPLPDEPMHEPGPMPPELAAALAKVRAKLAAEKEADDGHR